MQEWLTVIIVLLIVAVVLDGLRRMRQSRRSTLRMSRNVKQQSIAAVDDVNDYGSELPSGGARVVNVRKADDAVQRNQQIRQTAEQKRRGQLKSFRIPEQVSLNLDQKVPTLMESVGEAEAQARDETTEAAGHDDIARFQDDDRIEPVFSAQDSDDYEDNSDADIDEWDSAEFSDGSNDMPPQQRTESRQVEAQPVNIEPPMAPKPEASTLTSELPKPETPKPKAPPKADLFDEDEGVDYHEPELVLVINVMAQKGEQFPGADLLEIILSQGLRFGAMNIFHRHEEDNGDGEILYSMANIVVPGTFELAKMKTFSTPGVSLFMTLPMDANSIDGFEDMLTTAKIIAARLDGELKDENRSVLTPQTITHYRSKLQEFVRKQLSKAPA